MRYRYLVILPLLLLFGSAHAQPTDAGISAAAPAYGGSSNFAGGGSGALQASNVMNPNISVIGWFQGEAGHPHRPGFDAEAPLQLKETEIGFQSIVDPYARADFFASFDQDGNANLEEGYITWYHLPQDLAFKLGKFRSFFGPFNRTHPHDTPFATRPLVENNYFGEDGLAAPGLGLSWQVPNPWLYINLDGEALRPPPISEAPAFDRAQRNDLLYTLRANAYQDITDEINVSYGGSYAYGPAGQQFNGIDTSSTTLRSQLYGADITFRWKKPARAIYRSLIWQTVALWDTHQNSETSTVSSRGMFSWIQYQFAQRWATGVRYDYSQFPTDSSLHEYGGLVFLTYSPSEFSHLSLQGSHVIRADGLKENLGFLRVIFNIGPHGAHAF